jgi:hypothetical protein
MAKKVKLKYFFFHNDNTGNIYEDEKGNWIVVFDGLVRLGEPFHVHDMEGNDVNAEEIGLIQLLEKFVVAKPAVRENG